MHLIQLRVRRHIDHASQQRQALSTLRAAVLNLVDGLLVVLQQVRVVIMGLRQPGYGPMPCYACRNWHLWRETSKITPSAGQENPKSGSTACFFIHVQPC